ncbi:MAG TPA: RHS repeat-associated core domain-containing protein [Dehalococcoidia bacterium]|nr:RHS repeat-associated core domain-containing protein [Dehalococcoidia bacterium]
MFRTRSDGSEVVGSAGAVTDRYTYDVFGAVRAQTGTTANDFRFTGQQQDYNAQRGLYYLRARAYDPALGRFLQRDPLPFVQRYAYAGDNPANLVDPTGLCPWCSLPSPSLRAIQDWTAREIVHRVAGAVGASAQAARAAADAVAAGARVVEKEARQVQRFLQSDCFQGAVKVTALTTGIVAGTIILGPAAVGAGELFVGGALVDVQAAYFVAGSSVVVSAGANSGTLSRSVQLIQAGIPGVDQLVRGCRL